MMRIVTHTKLATSANAAHSPKIFAMLMQPTMASLGTDVDVPLSYASSFSSYSSNFSFTS